MPSSKYSIGSTILDVSKLYQRGKTQVPSEVRKYLKLEDGKKLAWVLENDKIFVKNLDELNSSF